MKSFFRRSPTGRNGARAASVPGPLPGQRLPSADWFVAQPVAYPEAADDLERVQAAVGKRDAAKRERLEREAVERSREEARPVWPTEALPWGEDAKKVDEGLST